MDCASERLTVAVSRECLGNRVDDAQCVGGLADT